MPRSPLFRTTTAARNKADPALEVVTTVSGQPLRWIRLVASKSPDSGLVHTVGINEATPVFDVADTGQYAFDFVGRPLGTGDPYLCERIFLKVGADGTTFTVIGYI